MIFFAAEYAQLSISVCRWVKELIDPTLDPLGLGVYINELVPVVVSIRVYEELTPHISIGFIVDSRMVDKN